MLDKIPIILEYKDGTIKQFESLGAAARYLGVSRTVASYMLMASRQGFILKEREENK